MGAEQMTDEQYVREAWKIVYHRDTAYSVPAGPHYVIIDNWRKRVFAAYRHTESEAWAAARAFTEQRIEECRQLREEIDWMRNFRDGQEGNCRTILTRSLDRLEPMLTDKQRGMQVHHGSRAND